MDMNKTTVFLAIGAAAIFATGGVLNAHLNSVERNTEFLQAKGYTSVEIGGYNLLCAKGSTLRRHFKAVNPKGQEVEGQLCAGRALLPDNIDITSVNSPVARTIHNKM